MNEAAESMNSEQAALLRDRIALIDRIREKQRAGFPNLDDKDIFAVEKASKQQLCRLSYFATENSYAQKYYFDYEGEPLSELMGEFCSSLRGKKRNSQAYLYLAPA